jgi:adenylate kinase family enzyme
MNIVEAYIKFNGQLVVLISGLPGCGKTGLGKSVARDFKIKLIDQYNYYKKDYDNKTTLPDNTTIVNWYTDDAIDWDKFNEDINAEKKSGVVVIGVSLPEDKLSFHPDTHIHLKISKQQCLEKRKVYLENNKDEYPEEYELLHTPAEKLKMNLLIFPYYLETIKKEKINKFININEIEDDKIYDEVFDYLINLIQNYLNSPISETTPKVTKTSENTSKPQTTDTISTSIELLDEPRYTYDDELDMVTKYQDFERLEDNNLESSDIFDQTIRDGPIKFISMFDSDN